MALILTVWYCNETRPLSGPSRTSPTSVLQSEFSTSTESPFSASAAGREACRRTCVCTHAWRRKLRIRGCGVGRGETSGWHLKVCCEIRWRLTYSTASLLHNRLAGFRHDEACGFPLYSWQRVVAGGLRFHSFARLVRIGAPWRHLVGHGQNRFRCQLQKASPKPPSLIGTAETSTFYESTRDEALSGICSPMPSTTLAPVAQQQRELLSVNEAIP